MTHTVVFDVAAQADLADIYDYLAPRAGARDAESYVDEIIDYCALFKTFPERGTHWPQRPGLRTVGFHRKATIAFQV